MRKTKQKQPYALSVRPPDHVRKKLAEAAKAAGRTLTKEMEMRLEASVGGIPGTGPDAFAGWHPADAAGFLAFGDLAGRLFAQVTLAAGTKMERKRRLRYALVALTAALDAEEAQPDENYFAALGHRVGDDEWIRKASKGQRTGLAVIIDLLKGWLASPSTDSDSDMSQIRKEI
jgi:hypothetical protein